MVRYNIDEVKEGMVLGKSIFLPRGELLLAASFELKEVHLKRLKSMGYHFVYINVEGTEDVNPEEIISEHTKQEMEISLFKLKQQTEKLLNIKEYSKEAVKDCIKSTKEVFKGFFKNPKTEQLITDIIDQIIQEPNLLLNVNTLKSADDYLYQHAINVTITSLSIARKFNFTNDEMKQLAMGSICFDIGMVAIPKSILNKPDKLTDDEKAIMREHTSYGYLMLKDCPKMSPTSAAIALQHHERQDGKGYPLGLKGTNSTPIKSLDRSGLIHRFAEIVSAADTYDSLISNRLHSGPVYPPADMVRILIEAAGRQLNSEIVKTLVSMVPIYPVGAKIRVVAARTTGLLRFVGVVAAVNKGDLYGPHIVLFETPKGQKIRPIFINMSEKKDVQIELLT